MTLSAVRGRGSLADEVFSQLMGEILEGRYKVGEYLPPERALTEIFEVNRHVVREALKRLAQVGMVAASQGGGTRVLDFHDSGGLDLLPWLGRHCRDARQGVLLWRAVLEMRAAVAIDMVRLCAMRAPQPVREQLMRIAQQQAERGPTAEMKVVYEGELSFWRNVVEGSHNVAYRLAMNQILKGTTAVEPQQMLTFTVWEARRAAFRVPLARAILERDVEKAEAEVRRTMREALEAFYERIGNDGRDEDDTRPIKLGGTPSTEPRA